MLNYKLFTVFAIILTSGILFEDAFAIGAGTEYTPTQTNAYASYTNSTNQIQISWNFNTMTPGDKCVIKADIEYQDRATNDHVPPAKISHYIPIYYSAISSAPTLIDIAANSGQYGEEVDCENDSFRIDLDTIMNSPLNIYNLDSLLIFLTFYATDDVTTYSLSESVRIDEVFVVYSPNEALVNGVLDDGTDQVQWSCNKQVGSVLFIDKSGSNGSIIAHGTNGDNCSKYEYIENNEYVDIGMINYPGLNLGEISKSNHVESAYSLLIEVYTGIITILSNGGSDDEHNSRPTFGLDHKTFVQRVDNGLEINGQIFTVTDNFYTPIPMQNMTVGVIQNFTSTVYAPHTLYLLEFIFGVPEVSKAYDAEASIEIYTNYDGDAIEFKINDHKTSPIINATSLEYSSSKVKCVADDNTEPCYRVSIEFSFNESPVGKVLALQAIDNDRANQILYFNDGLDIIGDSLNFPTILHIPSEIKYKGLQTVQRMDKEHDIWMAMDKSEPVLLYQKNSFETFIPIVYRTFEDTPDKLVTIIDRLHSEFYKLKEYENKRALEQFGYITSYKQIQGDDLTNYVPDVTPYSHTSRADNVVLQQGMIDAAERAELHLFDLLSKTHYAHLVNNDSTVGILNEFASDDRPISEILAEEREMKNALIQERFYQKQVISSQN